MCIAFRMIMDLLSLGFDKFSGLRPLAVALAGDQRGIESLEWAVIAAIVVVGAASTYGIIFPALGQFFNSFGTALNTLTVSL